ncbi:kinesin-like protein KIF16B isoform X2 [Dendroctonus ponderosae]|uniref:kinesin-like protein KIF16B isoform X2 n=1 Tax=Dendroctonus ponderosae TaxID=77166 RepID=UPI0020360895|nr:kinesin-like protein KIF16B isoform X2 [Dendroctonus ponderosae]
MMRLKVIVRVRPMSQREKQNGNQQVVSVENGSSLAITNIKVPEQNAGDSRERVRRFAFDYCFAEDASQDQIFETVENIVGTSLKKRNHSCVLAYGQTSSGKTHTMMGAPQDPGLTPRLCRRIFKYFQEGALNDETATMKVSVSYLEIYNEKVADLLIESDKKGHGHQKSLKVREHPKNGPYVEGLSQHAVASDVALLERLEAGTSKRRVGSTNTNPRSSRSHAVFSISCDGIKLHLVDLAGNERASSRGYGPNRFREGANINKSLVALGNVISTLAISPSSSYYSETVNTLRFGQRAKLIVYKPIIVEDSKEKTIRELRSEIARLRELLRLNNSTPSRILLETPMTTNSTENFIETDSERSNSDTFMSSLGDSFNVVSNSPGVVSEKENSLSLLGNHHEETPIKNNPETLLPVMNVRSSVESTRFKSLGRTYSMDRTCSVETDNSKSFSSLESLQSPKHSKTGTSRDSSSASSATRRFSSGSSGASSQPKQTVPLLKRQPVNRNSPMLKTITQRKVLVQPSKKEKGIVTEISGAKKIESKIDTGRKNVAKPRAQIVAAVTSRLYNKVHKKDIGTSTENLSVVSNESPKELSICSNARNRLRELTHRALKAHKSKNEETQTELFPILRVKEVATDCTDLVDESSAASTLEKLETKDVEVECTLLNQFMEGTLRDILVLTRSCGIQTNAEEKCSNISFTKYLTETQKNPIFTEAVNINISHNYINRTDSVSDDSLDNHHANVSFPTPDLISNHNSLEQQPIENSGESIEAKVRYAESGQLQNCFENVNYIPSSKVCASKADVLTVPYYHNNFKSVKVLTAQAPECILKDICKEYCQYLPEFSPVMAKAHKKDHHSDKCNRKKLSYYKPIIHMYQDCRSEFSSSESSEENFELNIPDSLEYQHKKVQFARNASNKKNDRVLKAMKNFLEEAKLLMANINTVAQENKCQQPHLEDFDIEVTVDDVSGFENIRKRARRKKHQRESNATQTEALPSMESSFSQTSVEFPQYALPVNKFESLLEDSCKRLEHKMSKPSRSRHISLTSEDYDDEILFQKAKYNPWDLSHVEIEDSSLESNPVTFSDYGSLPRRTHKRQRTPTCSPSAFLKQLTSMRRQIIETSREELLQGSSK